MNAVKARPLGLRRGDWWPVLVVVVVGLLVTTVLFRMQRDLGRERLRAEQEREATAVIDAVRDRLNLVEERLVAVRSLFAAVPQVSHDQFAAYVQLLLETRLAVETIEWAPRLSRPGMPDVFPVRFIEPFSGHAPKSGVDLAADPRWGEALRSAVDSGQMRSVSLPGPGAGVLVFLPVFAASANTDTADDRRRALRGFVVGLVRLEPLLRLAVAPRSPHFDALLRSVPGSLSLALAVGSREGLVADAVLVRSGGHSQLNGFAGLDMELIAAPNEATAANHDAEAWNVLVLGILATLASAVVAALLRSSKRRVIDLVAERTRALRESQLALEESRERLHLALVGAQLWAWDWDVRSDRLSWLDPPEPMLGPMPAGGWPDFRSLVHAEDYPAFIAAGRASLDQGLPYHCEFRVRRMDGALAWVAARGTVLRDSGGEASRLIGISLDITERKTTEETLRQARDAAEAASSAKTAFLATMSHEIRTPMNGVLGMAELLTMSDLTLEQREYVAILQDSGNALMAILNDILDYSKIESGRIDLEIAMFDVAQLGRDAIDAHSAQARRKGLALDLILASGLASRLIGDESRIRQVLAHLLGNAIKFTAEGRVVLRLMPATADGTGLRAEVSDTGIGIAPVALDQLFQPFFQADSSVTRRFGGTGLGLAICKRTIEAMRGRIGVETEPGRGSTRGSTFWFELPLKVVEGAAQAKQDHSHQGETPMPEHHAPGDPVASGPVVFDPSVLKEVTEAAGISPADLIDVFLNDADQSMQRIGDSIAKGDAALANRLAHSMKSSAANVGAMRLSVAARALEEATKAGGGAEAVAKQEALAAELAAFRQAALPSLG